MRSHGWLSMLLGGVLCCGAAQAQIPDKFTNLQVFPKDITKAELVTDPAVLHESRSLGLDDHVHPEPALVEAALGPNLVQPRERRGRQDREGKHIKERTDRNRRLHSKLGK